MDSEVIVGSADGKALYPSLDVDFTVDKNGLETKI